jgi:hypothetical protein
MGRAIWTPQYYQKVLALDPIAYWLLDEKSGTVAYDLVAENGAQNGTHTGVTLGQPGIGDGRTSPLYDGANDFTNIHSATLASAFSGDEGSISIWAKVSAAGVWTDAANRSSVRLSTDTGDYIMLYKRTVNNSYRLERFDGAIDQITVATSSTDWMHFIFTWSIAADEVRAYYNGALSGAPVAGLAAFTGTLQANLTNIGCANSGVPNLIWSGWLDECALFNRPLSADEASYLWAIQ